MQSFIHSYFLWVFSLVTTCRPSYENFNELIASREVACVVCSLIFWICHMPNLEDKFAYWSVIVFCFHAWKYNIWFSWTFLGIDWKKHVIMIIGEPLVALVFFTLVKYKNSACIPYPWLKSKNSNCIPYSWFKSKNSAL